MISLSQINISNIQYPAISSNIQRRGRANGFGEERSQKVVRGGVVGEKSCLVVKEREREREREVLWTIIKRLKVRKYNALSGNTASGRSGPASDGEYYTPTLRMAVWHALWRAQGCSTFICQSQSPSRERKESIGNTLANTEFVAHM